MKRKGIGFYVCIGTEWGGFRIDLGYGLRVVLGWFAISFTNYDIDWMIGIMAEELNNLKENKE